MGVASNKSGRHDVLGALQPSASSSRIRQAWDRSKPTAIKGIVTDGTIGAGDRGRLTLPTGESAEW